MINYRLLRALGNGGPIDDEPCSVDGLCMAFVLAEGLREVLLRANRSIVEKA
jgi:hypothetical protein